MVRVKMFKNVKHMSTTESEINEFLKTNNIRVIDIKYGHVECKGYIYYTAMIIYEI